MVYSNAKQRASTSSRYGGSETGPAPGVCRRYNTNSSICIPISFEWTEKQRTHGYLGSVTPSSLNSRSESGRWVTRAKLRRHATQRHTTPNVIHRGYIEVQPAELGFGERSYNEHTIIMQGVVRRDTRAQEYSRNCPEARRCKVHEGIGHPNSADCRIAKDHATMANVYQMGFTLNNLPLRFRNSSYSLDYISKYLLWPYMSNDPYRPSSNPHALNITVRIDPTTNTASAHVQKPFELTKFEQILLPFNVLYPPYVFSLRKSASKKVVDSLFGVDKTTCIADPKMIKTFDNMTLPRQPSTACWTLLTKDSTGVMKVAILEKHISGKPAVRILANHMDVQVSLDSSGSGFLVQPAGSSPVRVVRYQPVVLPHGQYPLVRVEQYADDHVEILLPEHYIRVRLSHEAVKVYAAQTVYRNKLIGVCGNMDSELRDEMRGPQGCILSRREQFLTSYIVALGREPSCHPVLPSPSTCVRSYLEQSIRSVHTY